MISKSSKEIHKNQKCLVKRTPLILSHRSLVRFLSLRRAACARRAAQAGGLRVAGKTPHRGARDGCHEKRQTGREARWSRLGSAIPASLEPRRKQLLSKKEVGHRHELVPSSVAYADEATDRDITITDTLDTLDERNSRRKKRRKQRQRTTGTAAEPIHTGKRDEEVGTA